tara:strand:- start:298 stop:471 length:174 start_codon:yes stop_codon:yes gene_type:complete
MIYLLIWFVVEPEIGVKYHHLSTHQNIAVCMSELKIASVLVNDELETMECIGVQVND